MGQYLYRKRNRFTVGLYRLDNEFSVGTFSPHSSWDYHWRANPNKESHIALISLYTAMKTVEELSKFIGKHLTAVEGWERGEADPQWKGSDAVDYDRDSEEFTLKADDMAEDIIDFLNQ